MFVLDTNVISELFRPLPALAVVGWIELHPPSRFFVTAISKAESLTGLALMPDGRRKLALGEIMRVFFEERIVTPILPFGGQEAVAFAGLVADRTRRGAPINEFDAQIAAIAQVKEFAVVTRNVRDFEHCGITIINPWEHA